MVDDHRRIPNDLYNNKDEDYSSTIVFPPINHENLILFSHQSESESPFSTSEYDNWREDDNSSSSHLFSPFDSQQVRKGTDFTGWLSIGLHIIRSKLPSAFTPIRNPSPRTTRSIWSFGIPFVILLMVLMRWKKNKNRQSNLTPNEVRLTAIIKEKDGKIAQLLNQIAQMNEILIDRHKALAAKVLK